MERMEVKAMELVELCMDQMIQMNFHSIKGKTFQRDQIHRFTVVEELMVTLMPLSKIRREISSMTAKEIIPGKFLSHLQI